MDKMYISKNARKEMQETLKKEDNQKDAKQAIKEGNRLVAKQEPNGLYSVYWSNRGDIPAVLSGKYTTINKVKDAIANYLTSRG